MALTDFMEFLEGCTCPNCGSDGMCEGVCDNCEQEIDLLKLINCAVDAGTRSVQMRQLRNFFIPADGDQYFEQVFDGEWLNADVYAAMMCVVNEIRDLYIAPLAAAMFYKTPAQLTSSERYDVHDRLSEDAHVAMRSQMLSVARTCGMELRVTHDDEGYPVWQYYRVGEAPAEAAFTLSYESEQGTAPEAKAKTVSYDIADKMLTFEVTLEEADLPVLSANGYTHTGWTANGAAVSVGDTVTADTTLTAVWEEAAESADKDFWNGVALGLSGSGYFGFRDASDVGVGYITGSRLRILRDGEWQTVYAGRQEGTVRYANSWFAEGVSLTGAGFGVALVDATVRLTLDGESRLYPFVSTARYYAGNLYLVSPNYGADDGFGLCVCSGTGDTLTFYFRDPGAHQVKVEWSVASR